MSFKGDIERSQIFTIKSDNRPTDYEYAVLSEHVYGPPGKTKPGSGSYCSTNSGKWTVLSTKRVFCGYFGAIYICEESKEMVVAHRGTNSLRDVFEDIRGIFFNQYTTPQKEAAFALVEEAVTLLNTDLYQDYHLSFTGHSLGAFLAELSVYHARSILRVHDVNAVTFESPGSKASILAMEEVDGTRDDLSPSTHFDIVSYVCYPNLINVCNEHIGTVYSINVDLGAFGSWPGIHLLRCHSMDGILEWFRQACIEQNPACKRHYMCDWPVGYREGRVYFKFAEFVNGQYTIKRPLRTHSSKLKDAHEAEDFDFIENYVTIQKRKFELRFNGNFKIQAKMSSMNALPLHHFRTDLQLFFKAFVAGFAVLQSRFSLESNKKHFTKLLKEKWSKLEMSEELIKDLISLRIWKNNIDLDVLMIDSGGASVSRFRRQLSCWLARRNLSIQDLLDITLSSDYTDSNSNLPLF